MGRIRSRTWSSKPDDSRDPRQVDDNLAVLGDFDASMAYFTDHVLAERLSVVDPFSIAIGCDGCIAYHTHDAVAAGATRPELIETIGVGVLMGGGPGSIYAVHALDAVDQFLPPVPA